MCKWNKYKKSIPVLLVTGFVFLVLFFATKENRKDFLADTEAASKVTLQEEAEVLGAEGVHFEPEESEQEQKDKKSKNRASDETKGDSKKRKKLVHEEEGQEQKYFTTSIVDGEIVTTANYAFTITQLDEELSVEKTNVYVNEHLVYFNGMVKLPKEENSIKVEVIYRNQKQERLTIAKEYRVYVDTENIIIYTDLEEDSRTDASRLAFTAYAYLSGEMVDLQVKLNGHAVKALENSYEVTLKKGKNTISFVAKAKGKQAKKSCEIRYEESTQELRFDTNLSKKTVYESSFSFYAKAFLGEKEAPLQVCVNEKEIENMPSGEYKVSLEEGENKISLTATAGEKKKEMSVTILYKNFAGTGEEVQENSPVINCSLEDGKQVKNKTLCFYVNAKDVHGNWLDQSCIQVKCGGKTATLIYANEDQISYKVTLSEGYNVIVISAKDQAGNTAKKAYSIEYKKQENETVGTATISVEATTIGCGSLISPTKVDIPEGKPLSYLLCELLEQKGFTYEYSGTMDNNFYLARINRKEKFLTPKIPKDLEAHLLEVDENYPGDYFTDSLGEYDFATGSGWMYQVNGNYPNYSFSDCYLQDEAVVRVRFTLHYGADIGGGMAKGNGGNEGDGGNWEKEW